jgi:hypothetical protein
MQLGDEALEGRSRRGGCLTKGVRAARIGEEGAERLGPGLSRASNLALLDLRCVPSLVICQPSLNHTDLVILQPPLIQSSASRH